MRAGNAMCSVRDAFELNYVQNDGLQGNATGC